MAQTCGISPEELRVREGEYPATETPLETAWTFWYDKKTSDKKESDQYMEGLRQLGSFNTVQGFYRHYSYLLRPSELPRDHNCYMFRKHYKPMWEEFPEGGCWIIRIKRKASQNYVNHMWENLLLACIGEVFEMPDVVGCVLSTRLKDDVLSVWNLSNRGTPARFRIGERLKEVLDLNLTALIQYKDHMQSLQDYSTYRNARNYMFAPSPNVTPLQGTLPTPLQTHHDPPDHDFDQGMLPPAAMDTMLPPAAVDSEGFGASDACGASEAWGASGKAEHSAGVGRSPALSAAAAPFTPPTQLLKSPPMSAQAAPFYPSTEQSGAASGDAGAEVLGGGGGGRRQERRRGCAGEERAQGRRAAREGRAEVVVIGRPAA
eukprot:CAMPEP_0176170850 /NCGR_PEP_ID=MMETSP0120_2-20121206/87463_1 /TAXON_ID=160619 /ORGANISM="Kryptoperidinium foliaceum, Strain CCMP 1326" /LENGTH=374 /DNA_ID=CAMNT_0017508659 /DNA_START=3 /DNA_END=1125 /DNA_ORIENTATION=-